MTRRRVLKRPVQTRPLPYRLRQNPKLAPPRAKGRLSWRAHLRLLLWSWRIWAVAAVAAEVSHHVFWALGLALLAIFTYLAEPSERVPVYGLDHEFGIDSEEFLSTIAGATDTPFLSASGFDIYNNGDEFYPAMLKSIEEATASITIEAYIFWAGSVGQLFAEKLASKAREGVRVKILLDAVGSSTIGARILETLKSGGCTVRWYRPIHWYTINRINHRTHRKSLIIDGSTAFTGGAGIADLWQGHAQDENHWRDIQVRIRGQAVLPLQAGFAQNWLKTTAELLSGGIFYPALKKPGALRIQTILSSPEAGSSDVRIMYYLSIVCARKTVWIANPYFIPDAVAVDILVGAKNRGVDVKIMLAGKHIDSRLARLNSLRLYGRLLKANIEIYEYGPTMLHQKYMVCDGVWSTIGTTNFDNRSLALNDENSVCAHDLSIASRFEEIFQSDLSRCEKIQLEAWRQRPLQDRVLEPIAAIFKEQA